MNEMKLEIWRLIKRYVKENRFPDKNYIIELIEIIVHFRKLEDYIIPSKTEFLRVGNGMTISDYSHLEERRNIRVFGDEVDRTLNEIMECKKFDFSNIEILLDGLFQISESIYHETEHANQRKTIDIGEDDFLTKMLSRSYNLGDTVVGPDPFESYKGARVMWYYVLKAKEEISIAKKVHLYHKYYVFAPEERLASIRALELTLDILNLAREDLSEDITNLYNFRYCRLMFELLNVYRKQSHPTKYYFSKLGLLDEEMNRLLCTYKYGVDERLRYGLYVPPSEVNKRWEEKEKIRGALKMRSQR